MCQSVICGWKQIVFSILVGSLAKKTAGRSTQLSPGKEGFLKDLFQQV